QVGHQLSEQIKRELNDDMEAILRQAFKTTQKLLQQKWELVEWIVHDLLEKEELELIDIKEIIEQYEQHR
ncbi:MAG TPA: hypothetical protein ENN77_01420, partial [Candidatus Wirthbacteria bacterium]|nr:hypothetical protein [Candidatus Wirthbacteria bacterium]